MRTKLSLVVVAAALASCSTADPLARPRATVVDDVLRVDLGDRLVDVGDTLTCFSTGYVTDREYAIGRPDGIQVEGGHHLAVYWTDDLAEFDPRPCTEADMINWHMIASAGNEGGGVVDDRNLPEGLAFRLPAGVHIVVQAHYINARGETYPARDSIEMGLLDPATIEGFAGYFAVNDGAFELPPRSRFRRVSDCTVAEPLSIVTLIGHMHENGEHFSLEYFPAGGGPSQMIYEHDWEAIYASHPPVLHWPMEAPFVIQPGDRMRMTCQWNNTSEASLLFPEEMCVTSTYYFPDEGEGLIVCDVVNVASETL